MSKRTLTDEQIQRCEANRKRALEIRASKSAQTSGLSTHKTETFYRPSSTKGYDKQSYTSKTTAPVFQSNLIKWNPPMEKNVSAAVSSTTAKIPTAPKFSWNAGIKSIPATCTMVDRQKFQVEMDYHSQSIEVFKSIPNRNYDFAVKRWKFDIEYHDKLVSEMKKSVPDVTFGGLPKNVLSVFKDSQANKTLPEVDLSKLNRTLLEALLPFQMEGVKFGVQRNGRVIIADDMGLGKTIQAIAITAYYASEWPLLVVTPSSVRYSWEESFHKWLPTIPRSEIVIINTKNDSIHSGQVIIMSYDVLSRRETEISKANFKVVIFDESHFLKNFKSARTKAAQSAVKQSNRVILLSGTPALSRPVELYTQIHMVNPKIFPNFPAFGIRYCQGKQMPWGWDYSGSSNMTELHLILQETVLIRRLKTEVLAQLPSKQRQMILLDPSLVDVKDKNLMEKSKQMSESSLVGMERRGVLFEFFQTTGRAKIKAVCHYIGELLEADQKFICFAHHQYVLDAICDSLFQAKCSFIRIDGSTTAENRKLYCDKFQFNDQCRVAVLSITAANAGINLTAAHLVVFAELYWNPGILTQAEDRAHRIGQEDCVIVQYLVASGTADDIIWPMVQNKLDTLSKAGLSKDNFRNAHLVSGPSACVTKQDTIESYFLKESEADNFWEDVSFDDPF